MGPRFYSILIDPVAHPPGQHVNTAAIYGKYILKL